MIMDFTDFATVSGRLIDFTDTVTWCSANHTAMITGHYAVAHGPQSTHAGQAKQDTRKLKWFLVKDVST